MRLKNVANTVLLYSIAIPVLGVLMGGLYSYPAMQLSKDREPWLMLLLTVGLSSTVIGLGYWLHFPTAVIAGCWIVAVVLLFAARRLYGSLAHNLERFGLVHAAILILMASIALLLHQQHQEG